MSDLASFLLSLVVASLFIFLVAHVLAWLDKEDEARELARLRRMKELAQGEGSPQGTSSELESRRLRQKSEAPGGTQKKR